MFNFDCEFFAGPSLEKTDFFWGGEIVGEAAPKRKLVAQVGVSPNYKHVEEAFGHL